MSVCLSLSFGNHLNTVDFCFACFAAFVVSVRTASAAAAAASNDCGDGSGVLLQLAVAA